MKPVKLCLIILISGILYSGLSFADETEIDYRQFIDIVYEWTPYGKSIQIGDYTISKFDSVWLDNGGTQLIKANTSYIKTGGLARVLLINQNDDGFWIAHKIIVFSGEGLKKAINQISIAKRKEYLKSAP